MFPTLVRVRPVLNAALLAACSLALSTAATAQTFEIQGQKPQQPAQQNRLQKSAKGKPQGAASPSAAQSSGGSNFAWGTSIDVARQARAAEDALKRGKFAEAANYATHAANAAPQETRLWLLAGYANRLAGNDKGSVDAFKRGLQNDPNSLEGLSGLAQTYSKMGNFNEAKALLMRVIALNPKRANDLAVAGEMFLNSGDARGAADMLNRAENIQPASRTELLLASAYLKLKDPTRAKQYLQKAVRRDPNNKETLRAMANFYREEKDYPSAIATLKKLAKKNPDILAELGYTYELAQDFPQAADAYASAADLAPQQIAYQIDAAQSYVHVGNFPKAQKYLQRAAQIDPNHYRLHGLQGEMARTEHRNDDAIKEYTLALQNMPESVPEGVLYPIQLRTNLSDSYHDSNDDADAKAQAKINLDKLAAIQVDPARQPDYLRLRAAAHTTLEDFPAAQEDIKQALVLVPDDTNMMVQFGNLLWHSKHTAEAGDMFKKALAIDPKHRAALTQLGFLSRELGDSKSAEMYFTRLGNAYPNEYPAFLALGDLYTSQKKFDLAEKNYEAAYKINQTNPMIVGGGANAGIESHNLDRAGMWLARATPEINEHPFVMRERERWLTWKGRYLEAANLGYKVIQKMPKDRDAVVYLGYSLLYLGRYDDLLKLTAAYEPVLNKDAAVPLLTGYVYRKSELLDEAAAAFSRSIERNDKAATAYINRGYVYNDLQNPALAVKDFTSALALEPNNGEANLGLAYSYLQLREPAQTLKYVDRAAKVLGESKATHLARAGGYRQRLLLAKAEAEYRDALKIEPDNAELRLALAQTLLSEKHYNDAIKALQDTPGVTDDHAYIYAALANASAHLKRKDDAYRYIAEAEKESGDSAPVLLASGDSLLALGDNSAAMEHYARALSAPDASRVDVRLSFARTFQAQGHWADARQQIALAFTEARVTEGGSPITPDNLATAAAIFLSMNDFDLAKQYYQMAQDAGADERPVRIGMANTFIAQGDFRSAQAELAGLGTETDNVTDYDYMMAYGALNRQKHDNIAAMMGFARAHELSLDDPNAERSLHDVAGDEGYPITKNIDMSSDFHVEPIFEDATVYDLDAKIRGISNNALLPAPRSSTETLISTNYRMHFHGMPTLLGTYSERNARGQFVFPSDTVSIFNRDTYDTNVGLGVNPTFRLGNVTWSFTPGFQFTIRRDRSTPFDLNQNLIRTYLYMSSTPLFNWIAIKGDFIRESGPFTERDLSSKDKSGSLEFTVGRPWGRTALITGYRARDLQFDPTRREFFTTSSYAGLQRRFGQRTTVGVFGEYIRSWRVDLDVFAIAQAMRPAAQFDFRMNNRWEVQGTVAYTREMGSPIYDNMNSGFLVTYTHPLRHAWTDAAGTATIEYPLKFSFGLQQQQFPNYVGTKQSSFVPVIRLSIF